MRHAQWVQKIPSFVKLVWVLFAPLLMGIFYTMKNYIKHSEQQRRADRLKEARQRSGIGGARKVSEKFGWNENNYKAHEAGRNGFSPEQAEVYAKAFNVNASWLIFGHGAPDDPAELMRTIVDVPLISWVSAGQLSDQDGVTQLDEFPTIPALDLPLGDWIALRVDGDSMNKISPPGSVIFVNLKDTRLTPNGCYIVSDETGAATYKRYRPNADPVFQPASYEAIEPPRLHGMVRVLGRVRRSIIEM